MTKIEELEKKLGKDKSSTPKPEESGDIQQLPTAKLEAKIGQAENEIGLLKKTLDFVQNTNRFILAVLFLGFITLLVAFLTLIIETNNSRVATEIEFIKSVEELRNEVKSLRVNLPQPTSTPINIPMIK